MAQQVPAESKSATAAAAKGKAYPFTADPGRAANMRGNRRADTKPELALRAALHALGYRGHITTKSRLFSTTMGALRTHRAEWTRHHHTEHVATTSDAELHGAAAGIDPVAWEFDRVGLCSLGERALILSAAQRMIEHRHIARDNLRAHDPPAHREQTT